MRFDLFKALQILASTMMVLSAFVFSGGLHYRSAEILLASLGLATSGAIFFIYATRNLRN